MDLGLPRRTTTLSTVLQGERETMSKSKAGVCELWKDQLQGFLSGGQDAKGPACNKLVFCGLMGLRKELTLSCKHSSALPRERFVHRVTSSTGGDGHGWTAWQVKLGLPELRPRRRKESV